MSENITQGNFRASIGAAVVSFNVTDDLAQVAKDLDNAYGMARTVLNSMGAPVSVKPIAQITVEAPTTAESEAVAKTEKVKPFVRPEAKAEPEAVAAAEPEVVKTPDYTLADIRKALGVIIDLGQRLAAEQYVQYHCKTKRTSEIPSEQYPAMMADLEEMAAGLASGKYSGYDSFAKAKGYELTPEAEG